MEAMVVVVMEDDGDGFKSPAQGRPVEEATQEG